MATKKYRVVIPPPKAKRLQGTGKLTLYFSDGWNIYSDKVFEIGDATTFEFTISDEFEYEYNTSVSDGPTFACRLEYSNQSGSRKESFSLVPGIIDDKK